MSVDSKEPVLQEPDKIPVIDLFAGPGGLGEGFASAGFDVALSCEMDATACETLRLRKFFHLFPQNNVPEEYYDVIKGNLFPSDLENSHKAQFDEANRRVMEVELGNDASRRQVHRRIRQSLDQYKKGKDFILVGGPPCQAYSLAGRSRRLGGHPLDENGDRISSNMLTVQDIETIENRKKLFFDDPKHTLYLEYLEIIALHRPAVFIMENVKGMTSAKSIDSDGDAKEMVFDRIVSDLEAPGKALADKHQVKELADEFELDPTTQYRLMSMSHEDISSLQPDIKPRNGKDFVLRSENYGIPQARHRVFVVGVRNDLDGRPERLSPKAFVTVREIIEKMPKLRSGLSKTKDSSESWANEIELEFINRLKDDVPEYLKLEKYVKSIKKYAGTMDRGSKYVPEDSLEYSETVADELIRWLKDDRLKGVIQHETRGHISSDLARYLYCSAYALNSLDKKSPKIEDWHTEKLKPDHANVKKRISSGNGPKLKASGHSDRFRVQVWHKPSTTVVSHISKDGHYFIHPDPMQCRSLTVREAARLQTFPDNYFFCGNRTQQYHQVGNAVPPYLALQIANSVRDFASEVIEKRENAPVKRIA